MSGTSDAATQPPVQGKSFADAAAQPPTTNGRANKGKPVRVAKPKEDGSIGYSIVEQERKEQEYVLRNRMNGKSQAQHKGKDDGNGVYENNVVYENIPNGEGSFLTTVKPSTDFEASLLHSELTKPRSRSRGPDTKPTMTAPEPELKSGRQPGKGWDQSAIRWAPLNVPLKRRFQTMAVLWHSITIAVFLSIFFFTCAFPPAWLLLTPYLIYSFVLYDDPNNGTLSRRSEFLKQLKIWSSFGEYFPAQLHKTQDLEPYRKYIFGYHPHGIISHGAFAAFATEALGFSVLFPGITNTLLTLETNFRIPFYRDYALAMGLASVSRESITNILSKGGRNGRGMGRAVTIVIGGARESLEARPHQMKLILNERKGFIKQAIRTGADLVPVIGFGENDLYDQVDSDSHPLIRKAQLLVKKLLGFTLPLFHARGIFNYDSGLMPYRRALNIVVGKPIEVEQQGGEGEGDDGHIEVAYIEELHRKYVAEVKRLWETHKDRFAPDREMELEIE